MTITCTPGPWTFEPKDAFRAEIVNADKTAHVADVLADGGGFIDGPVLANARLIAAAPELLEALERLVFAVEETDELGKKYIRNSQAYKDSKAAIRKARVG